MVLAIELLIFCGCRLFFFQLLNGSCIIFIVLLMIVWGISYFPFRLLIIPTVLYSSFSFFGHVNHIVGLSGHGYSKLRLVILIRSL